MCLVGSTGSMHVQKGSLTFVVISTVIFWSQHQQGREEVEGVVQRFVEGTPGEKMEACLPPFISFVDSRQLPHRQHS